MTITDRPSDSTTPPPHLRTSLQFRVLYNYMHMHLYILGSQLSRARMYIRTLPVLSDEDPEERELHHPATRGRRPVELSNSNRVHSRRSTSVRCPSHTPDRRMPTVTYSETNTAETSNSKISHPHPGSSWSLFLFHPLPLPAAIDTSCFAK